MQLFLYFRRKYILIITQKAFLYHSEQSEEYPDRSNYEILR